MVAAACRVVSRGWVGVSESAAAVGDREGGLDGDAFVPSPVIEIGYATIDIQATGGQHYGQGTISLTAHGRGGPR